MKLDFSRKVFSATAQKVVLDKEGEQATLAEVVAIALVAPPKENITPEESYRRGKLAQRIHIGGEIDISAEEIALAKKCVGLMWTPGIVAPVWDLLEGN